MISASDPLDFVLPPGLEAHEPPEARGLRRDEVRLLVTHRGSDAVAHARFFDLPDLLRAGDLLVGNDSATVPAALTARRDDGSELALHLSTRLTQGTWVAEPRQTEVRRGDRLSLPAGGTAILMDPYIGSNRLWVARLMLPERPFRYLERWGRPITYSHIRGNWPLECYQTVYASVPGSAEMPSAGRAFSFEILDRLRQKGVRFATLTLHAGVSSLEEGEMPYPERFVVPRETAEVVERTRAARGRVIAIGTTVVRALESASDESGCIAPAHGWTHLVVTPERGVRAVDGMLTGFHEPRASHLAMLEAVVGRARLATAYRVALEECYLWHEFGDMHLILP